MSAPEKPDPTPEDPARAAEVLAKKKAASAAGGAPAGGKKG